MSIFGVNQGGIEILTSLKELVWGFPTLALLVIFGAYFSYKSGFYRFKAIKKISKDLISSLKSKPENGISPISAVATALGGTVGVGSIVGVGLAISVGGAGSIFWMWVCSFFGMGLKYAEVKIALNKRQVQDGIPLGGAHVRLKNEGFPKISLLFCLFCILASFGTGNFTQVGALGSFLSSAGIAPSLSAIICVAIIGLVVFGGRKRIAKINTLLVPSASAVYITFCVAVLVMNLGKIPSAFSMIFKDAFGMSSVVGGFSGAALSRTLREGFARSIFSNEAGMGSSPLAHSTAETDNIEIQSEWGIFEIFFDTFVVSTLTAICLLSSGFASPQAMFEILFGGIGKWAFGLLSAVFAFASVISWCYYAECCISFLFPKNSAINIAYRIVFSLSAAFGVYISLAAIWELADILNALMMFPNLFLLFKCRKEIERTV